MFKLFGDAIVDLVYNTSREAINRLGLPIGSYTRLVTVDQFHALHSQLSGIPNQLRGGALANTASALSQLGNQVEFFCSLGSDAYADFFVNDMTSLKTFTVGTRHATTTGVSLCLIDEFGERTMATFRGAADIPIAPLEHATASGQMIHAFENYIFLSGSEQRENILRFTARAPLSTIKILSLGSTFAVEQFKDFIGEWQTNLDIIVGNEEEVSTLFDLIPLRDDLTIICTLGSNGSKILTAGSWEIIKPVRPNIFVDSLGAGDAFFAGFLDAIGRGKKTLEAVRAGNSMGAFACTKAGTSYCKEVSHAVFNNQSA